MKIIVKQVLSYLLEGQIDFEKVSQVLTRRGRHDGMSGSLSTTHRVFPLWSAGAQGDEGHATGELGCAGQWVLRATTTSSTPTRPSSSMATGRSLP